VFVAAVRFDLHLPQVHSLKEKRAVLRPVLDGARHRFGVSSAEVGEHDRWQRAVLGMAVVSSSAGHAIEVLDRLERFVWSFPELDVVVADRVWLDS
jgi:uncharacterized protein YlxP (DUF503 family)